MDTPALRFAVLGPVRAWRGAEELVLGGPQQRALLAVLLLNRGRAMPMEFLVDALWGDEPPTRAVGTVRTYAARLRKVLENDRSAPKILVSAGKGYALRLPPGLVDAEVFEARAAEASRLGERERARELLGSALDLWQGAPLSALPGPYLQERRARLVERRLSVLQARLEVDLELGRHAQVVGELSALSDEHPLREALRGLLMIALYRCGRQAEALECYVTARRTMSRELGIDPGPQLRRLHEQILRNDPSLTWPSSAPSPAPVVDAGLDGPADRPASLPADLADFTGRKALVSRISEWLLDSSEGRAPVVVTVSGVGGVGKTALAVHVAHTVRGEYPDGQLYIDLLGAGEHPLPPAVVLGDFLRALGVPDSSVPEGEAERSALFRSLLSGRRVLIVLDNARDAEQVRPLLPGAAGCAVVVTSRARPSDLPGAHAVDLDVLDPLEAITLFTGVVGTRAIAERRAVVDVVALCGFLPLAVRVAAARLAARPSWSVRALASRLMDGRRRLAELRIGDLAVEATFRLGYDQLDAPMARAFRLLAVPEVPALSAPMAAALLDLTPAEAERVLESLADLGLLVSPCPDRYRYHDLLGLFARQVPPPEGNTTERRRALQRLVQFTLDTHRAVLQEVRPGNPLAARGEGFESAAEAREWTARELTGTLTIVRQAAQAPDDDAVLRDAAELLVVLDPVLEDGYRWDEARPAARAVLDEAVRRHDRWAEGRARYVLGRLLTHTSRLAEAREHAERAVALGREGDDRVLLMCALDGLSHIAFYEHNMRGAIDHIEQALTLSREFGDRAGEAERTGSLAYAYVEVGEASKAVPAAERSRELARQAQYGAGEAYALYTLGIALRELGRLDEAEARFDDGLAICRSQGLRARESYILLRLAETRLRGGRPAQARDAAEKSLAIGREIGEEYQQGRALATLGQIFSALGDAGEAKRLLEDALDLFTALQVPEADEVRGLLSGVGRGG